jgi:phenylacetate-CoA ligase
MSQDDLRRAAMKEMERVEYFNRQELAAWQLDRLNKQLAHAFASSSFYRAQRQALKLPTSLNGLDLLAQFPFTTKDDLRDQYPFGLLAASRRELVRYGESTGTSGRPTSSFFTYEDWIRGNVWVEAALRHYFSPDDMVFIAIPYELTFASYDIDRALEQQGCTVVPVGTLNQICPFSRLIEMMRELHPTGLVCTPTRALRLFDMLVEDGHDPLQIGLQKLLYVGETCSPSKLRKIAETWKIKLVTAYGSTETNSLALPCCYGKSHLSEGRYFFEVIDDVSGTPLPAGQMGELVLTSLCSQAMPLIRYRTGDLVAIEERPCACGSPRRILQHHGRIGEAVEVGGAIIQKLTLEETILATPGTGTYYAAGVRDGVLHVLVEVTEGRAAEVCQDVREAIRQAHQLDCVVEPVPRRTMTAAMDSMLKPGSLQLDDLERVACLKT